MSSVFKSKKKLAMCVCELINFSLENKNVYQIEKEKEILYISKNRNS